MDACQFFTDMLRKYTTFEELPVNGDILLPTDDDDVRTVLHLCHGTSDVD
jgi:hypothetical protein